MLPEPDSPGVLFVDDEPIVRKAGHRILTRLGCRVFLAANGEEALTAYRDQQDQIDLVILDLSMPEMNGFDCLSALIEFDPNAQVILSSGYNDTEIEEILNRGAIGLLPKPYDADTLISFIKKRNRKNN